MTSAAAQALGIVNFVSPHPCETVAVKRSQKGGGYLVDVHFIPNRDFVFGRQTFLELLQDQKHMDLVAALKNNVNGVRTRRWLASNEIGS